MNTIAVSPVAVTPHTVLSSPTGVQMPSISAGSFSQMLTSGIDQINDKIVSADNMVRAFALDDSIPVHQVTYALDQARMSLELGLQVRTRLLEGFQQLMNMQI